MIVAAIFFFFSAGLVVKMLFSPVSGGEPLSTANFQRASSGSSQIESQVKLVAANFRCACGGCGELFLVDCTCDMARGAKEEKDFIRNKLQQGLSIDQVVDLVDREYGHKII
jgi:cytochrome c-type biogenesis protein CcmH/NrfF